MTRTIIAVLALFVLSACDRGLSEHQRNEVTTIARSEAEKTVLNATEADARADLDNARNEANELLNSTR